MNSRMNDIEMLIRKSSLTFATGRRDYIKIMHLQIFPLYNDSRPYFGYYSFCHGNS